MRELAAERRRFGYRRLHVLLRQEGLVLNRKRTQRLYREEGLMVRRRRGRKRATGARAPLLLLTLPNTRCCMRRLAREPSLIANRKAGPTAFPLAAQSAAPQRTP
jgi:transposase InsO family protein